MTSRPTLVVRSVGYLESAGAEYNTAALDQARWEQELLLGISPDGQRVAGEALQTAPMHARPWLINGGFERWSRGSSFAASGTAVATADAWNALNVGVALDTAHGSTWVDCLQGTLANTVAAFAGNVSQTVYGAQELRGRKCACYGWVRGAVLLVQLNDGAAQANVVVDGTAGWTPVRVYQTPGASMANMVVTVYNVTGLAAQTFYLDDFWFGPVDAPVPYLPEDPALAMRRNRRRLAVVPWHGRFRATAAGQVEQFPVTLPGAPMETVPTGSIGLSGVLGTDYTNVSSIAVAQIDQYTAAVALTATAAGDCFALRQTLTVDCGAI